MGEREHYHIFRGLAMGCVQENKKRSEKMIDEIINFLLGLIDDTWNSDEDANEKLKEVEKCKLKKLRRK